MFEKEAKKRAGKIEENQTLGVYDSDEDYARDIGYNEGQVVGYEEGFQDGAEFGYELGKNECHYIKDGDLPKEGQEVIVLFTLPDKSKNDIMIAEFKNNDFNFVDLDAVIAWKEIAFPKLK